MTLNGTFKFWRGFVCVFNFKPSNLLKTLTNLYGQLLSLLQKLQ